MRKILLLVCFCVLGLGARATVVDSVKIFTLRFPQSENAINNSEGENDAVLKEMEQFLSRIASDSEREIVSVDIIGYTSPEGTTTFNSTLGKARADAALAKVRKVPGFPMSICKVSSPGCDWEGLRALVRGSGMKYEKEILKTLDLPLWISENGKVVDSRKNRLIKLQKGEAWNELTASVFPLLRRAEVKVVYRAPEVPVAPSAQAVPAAAPVASAAKPAVSEPTKPCPDVTALEKEILRRDNELKDLRQRIDSLENALALMLAAKEQEAAPAEPVAEAVVPVIVAAPIPEPVVKAASVEPEVVSVEPESTAPAPAPTPEPIPESAPEPEPQRPFHKEYTPIFAIGTNALYDLALTPNLFIEVPIGRHFSAGVDGKYASWITSDNAHAWQIAHIDFFARYWFFAQDEPYINRGRLLTGPFVGIAFGTGKYDLEPNHTGWQGKFIMARAEGGYSWWLSRCWRFSLSLGLGWMGTDYHYYEGDENDQHLYWRESGRLDWPGPVSLGASFTWLIHSSKKIYE